MSAGQKAAPKRINCSLDSTRDRKLLPSRISPLGRPGQGSGLSQGGPRRRQTEGRSLEGVLKPILASEDRREASRYRWPGSRTKRRTPGAGRAEGLRSRPGSSCERGSERSERSWHSVTPIEAEDRGQAGKQDSRTSRAAGPTGQQDQQGRAGQQDRQDRQDSEGRTGQDRTAKAGRSQPRPKRGTPAQDQPTNAQDQPRTPPNDSQGQGSQRAVQQLNQADSTAQGKGKPKQRRHAEQPSTAQTRNASQE